MKSYRDLAEAKDKALAKQVDKLSKKLEKKEEEIEKIMDEMMKMVKPLKVTGNTANSIEKAKDDIIGNMGFIFKIFRGAFQKAGVDV